MQAKHKSCLNTTNVVIKGYPSIKRVVYYNQMQEIHKPIYHRQKNYLVAKQWAQREILFLPCKEIKKIKNIKKKKRITTH